MPLYKYVFDAERLHFYQVALTPYERLHRFWNLTRRYMVGGAIGFMLLFFSVMPPATPDGVVYAALGLHVGVGFGHWRAKDKARQCLYEQDSLVIRGLCGTVAAGVSRTQAIRAARRKSNVFSDAPRGNPLNISHTVVSSGFGYRSHPMLKIWRMHEGVDLDADFGTQVYSVDSGVVVFAGYATGYGKLVRIEHANRYETRYAHLSKIEVEAGVFVAKGDKIGQVGKTGLATSSHLHYEIRRKGRPINPIHFLK